MTLHKGLTSQFKTPFGLARKFGFANIHMKFTVSVLLSRVGEVAIFSRCLHNLTSRDYRNLREGKSQHDTDQVLSIKRNGFIPVSLLIPSRYFAHSYVFSPMF